MENLRSTRMEVIFAIMSKSSLLLSIKVEFLFIKKKKKKNSISKNNKEFKPSEDYRQHGILPSTHFCEP
jgi:hypothetical protein